MPGAVIDQDALISSIIDECVLLCITLSDGVSLCVVVLQCPIEWFHYGCVGLTEAPKGKWFCPQCTAAMKRRGSRHK